MQTDKNTDREKDREQINRQIFKGRQAEGQADRHTNTDRYKEMQTVKLKVIYPYKQACWRTVRRTDRKKGRRRDKQTDD
jgi:hypothetical protein